METVSALLKQSFDRWQNKDAVVDNGVLTYKQLYHNAACIASALTRSGTVEGDFVAIYLPRSKEYITALMGCLLFGYCAVLLDTEYPDERIRYMLKDSGAKVVIDGTFFDRALGDNTEEPYHSVSPATNALVVYTSGSTGNPKGVLHDQLSVHNAIKRFMRSLDYNEHDVYGSSAPYTFIAVGIDIIYPLCVGAMLHVVPRDAVKVPSVFSAYIAEHHITATNIPPKILKVFEKTGDSLRVATTGSEKVSNIFPKGFRVFNLYGMSEGFPSVSIFEIDRAYDVTPIGKGDGSLAIYLLDDGGNIADEGEICVAGHLFSGYLHLEEQTKKVLVPNPFAERDGHPTLFHTNDMGKRLPDGNIVYVNRKDWMIKINGFRVEPGEIEVNIKTLPGIFDCVVKGFTRSNGTPYLAAFYVEKEPVSVDDMRSLLASKYPYYMIPSYFVRMENLPVNNNGKLDFKALKEPETANISVNYVKPVTPLQSELCKMLVSLLSVKKVGIKDDIFSLGAGYEEANCIATRFAGRGIDEKLIYRCKTVENITAALDAIAKGNPDEENSFALSLPQQLTAAQRYYVDYQLYSPMEDLCRLGITVSVSADRIDAESLKNSIETCLLSHPVLNSRFVFDDAGDIVLCYERGKTSHVDCYACTEQEYRTNIKSCAKARLPLINSLLYTCTVYSTEVLHHIHFDIHRGICDSLGLMNIIKSVVCAAEGAPIPPDYYYVYLNRINTMDRSFFNSDSIRQIRRFLEDEACCSLPEKDTVSRNFKCEFLHLSSGKTVNQYKKALSAHHTSFETVLVSAGLLALCRYNRCDTAAVNWMFGGRDELWQKDAVGLLAAAVPIGLKLSAYTSLIDLMKDVQAQRNSGVAFSKHLAYLGSTPGRKDLLQLEFADSAAVPAEMIYRYGLHIEESDNRSNQFRILAVEPEGDTPVMFRFAYNAECYGEESVRRFGNLLLKAFDICCFGTLKDWLAI